MPRVKKLDLGMTALDELFMNDKERAENKLPKIFDIPLSEIDDFPDHPYRVLDDEDMQNLMESISERGVITPAMVRKKDDGRYEMISGHRRKHASERLGLETLRCEVVEVSRDEAVILMVDSNSQRSEIAPTDKGRAYKMKLDAIKRLPGRPSKENGGQVGHNYDGIKSRDLLAENAEDSGRQIQRYIRLTYLVPELQEFVDKGQMKMRPAVELSYLDEETQRDIVDRIDETEAFPSHDQAIRIRKAFEAGEVSYDKVQDIMAEEKPNQKPKFKFSFDRLKPYIPKDYTDSINLPHHELTTRRRMPRINRTASFSPFAALTGYDAKIKETGRLTDEKIELDDSTVSELNDKLNFAMSKADEQPEITVTYFLPDKRKSGGAYITHTGVIKRIDEYERRVIFTDKTAIPIDDIYGIDGDIFIGLY